MAIGVSTAAEIPQQQAINRLFKIIVIKQEPFKQTALDSKSSQGAARFPQLYSSVNLKAAQVTRS
jgi:hypothetical protein